MIEPSKEPQTEKSVCDEKSPARTRFYAQADETLEDLGRGGMRLIQPKGRFRYGMDSVLLADFAAPRAKGATVDLGAGCGVIGLLIAARREDIPIDLVELNPDMASLCERNIALNGLAGRMRAYNTDIRCSPLLLGHERYALAVCNPPYFDAAVSVQSQQPGRGVARQDECCPPVDLAQAAFSLLKNGGRFCAVYPAERAMALLCALENARVRPKRLRCVQKNARTAPKRILIEAVKGAGAGLTWLAPLLLCDESGQPSDEYRRIYNQK